jgi:radical SAM protein with 4Fe4S-binding SPASM domain
MRLIMLDLARTVGDCSHLRVYNRAEKFIFFNPTIPSWVYSNSTGAIILKIASQGFAVDQVIRVAADNGVSPAAAEQFFETCFSARLFEIGEKSARWKNGTRPMRRIQSIYLHLTNKCNLSCSYCYRNSSPRISISRFGDEFNGFLDASRELCEPNTKLTFSGGEPMIHPDFWSVAEHAKAIGFTNYLLTNGTFVTAVNAPMLADLFKYIKISLDGASEATHAKTRGEGNFDAVINAIHLLSQYSDAVDIEVQMTVNSDNAEDVTKLKSMLPDGSRIKYTPHMGIGRGLQADSNERLTNEAFHSISRQTEPQEERTATRLKSGQRTLGCYAGDAHISVADNGDVYPCHLFHQNAFKMGNIFVDTIADIFHSTKMTDFAASMDVENNNARCSSCDFRYLCGGGCKANALHEYRDYRKSDTYCGFIRNTLLDDLFAGWRAPGKPIGQVSSLAAN